MPAFTPFLNLYKPGGGSTGLITPDEVADIDRLNANSDLLDAWATRVGEPTSNRRTDYYGTAAGMGGALVPPPKDGDTYQESDGNKILWKRMGGVWVTNEGSAFIIRPTSLTGSSGTVAMASDGTINVGAAAAICLNGIFSSRFRDVEITWSLYRTVGGTPINMRMRNAGADDAAANYHWRRAGTAGGGYVEGTVSPANLFAFSVTDYTQQKGRIRIQGADLADATRIYDGAIFDTSGGSFAQTHSFVGEHRLITPFDGCSFFVGAGTVGGKIRVTGFPFE